MSYGVDQGYEHCVTMDAGSSHDPRKNRSKSRSMSLLNAEIGVESVDSRETGMLCFFRQGMRFIAMSPFEIV